MTFIRNQFGVTLVPKIFWQEERIIKICAWFFQKRATFHGYNKSTIRWDTGTFWPLSRPILVRFSKFFFLLKAYEKWFLKITPRPRSRWSRCFRRPCNTFSYASHLNFEMINVSCSLEQHDPSPAHFSWQQLVTKFYYGQTKLDFG